jgi:hypothetical protein
VRGACRRSGAQTACMTSCLPPPSSDSLQAALERPPSSPVCSPGSSVQVRWVAGTFGARWAGGMHGGSRYPLRSRSEHFSLLLLSSALSATHGLSCGLYGDSPCAYDLGRCSPYLRTGPLFSLQGERCHSWAWVAGAAWAAPASTGCMGPSLPVRGGPFVDICFLPCL